MKQPIIQTIIDKKQPFVLLTAYEISGSTPCQVGSMLAVFKDYSLVGTVGGGLIEAKAIETAKVCLEKQASDIVAVDMMGKNPSKEEMICGGTVKIWAEYFPDSQFFHTIANNIDAGELVIRISKIGVNQKTIAIANAKGELLSGNNIPLNHKAIAEAITTNESFVNKDDGLFYQIFTPPEKLLILGAGHVGKAIAYHANTLGFEVTLADSRAEFVDPSLHPKDITCLNGDLSAITAAFNFGVTTYAIVVSHSHLTDLECAKALMDKEYRYAGLMGSRRKVKMIIDELKKLGFNPNKADALYAPIGLDISAITPHEIAIAILAEIIAVRRNASNLNDFLKMKIAKRVKV